MNYTKKWIIAIRPKTLVLSFSPVLLGTVIASSYNKFNLIIFLLTTLSAIFMQITSNIANDYYDGITGIDKDRLGPIRVTNSGLLKPSHVKIGFILTAIFAFICGIPLIYSGGILILIVGILSIIVSILYTYGPIPISHYPLGELFAFSFFGPIATWGTIYLQTGYSTSFDFYIGIGLGLLSASIMAINNLRDREQDIKSNKKTLATILPQSYARFMPIFFILSSAIFYIILYLIKQRLIFLLPTIAYPFFIKNWLKILSEPIDHRLNKILAKTAIFTLLYSILLSIGFLI